METKRVEGVDYQLGADGQWYPVNRAGREGSAWAWLVGAGVVVVFIIVALAFLGGSSGSDATLSALDDMWQERSPSEQLSLCATYRLSGERAVVREFMDAKSGFDEGVVADWWHARCGR